MPGTLIVAQAIAGAAAAASVPTLVMLIADNYPGSQKTKPLAWLAAFPLGIANTYLTFRLTRQPQARK